MENRANATETEPDSADELRPGPALPDAVMSTEVYETEDGVVLYDAQNPLAWVQAEGAVPLQDAH